MKFKSFVSTTDLARQIAQATRKTFYLSLSRTDETGRSELDFSREWIGGKRNDGYVGTSSLLKANLLVKQGSLEGVSLLHQFGDDINGVRNNRLITVLQGWDDGGKIDLMLSLLLMYSLEHKVVLHSILFEYESLEDRDQAAEIDRIMFGDGQYSEHQTNEISFLLGKKFYITHSVHDMSRRHSIGIYVTTSDHLQLIGFIAQNMGLIPTELEGGAFSVGLLFEGKRIEIVVNTKFQDS